MCVCVYVCVRVQKIVRRIKNYNNCHNNSTGGKKGQSSGWEYKQCAVPNKTLSNSEGFLSATYLCRL